MSQSPVSSAAVLTMAGDVRIAVPDALGLITSYVLCEQQDWFEDEIHFVRTLLSPSDRILDIGANYGTYTLSMARIVGDSGHVWAFEPATSTAAYLARSIELNGLRNVTLTQAALSDHAGRAQLGLHPNSELNSLRQDLGISDSSEEVTLFTLDQCREDFGWRNIAFIKLDAEGEESNILQGGAGFLGDESPLVMFELKHLLNVNVRLIEDFAALGYDAYRLVPGLNLLAPYSLQEQPDPYQLNLFGCKSERAAELAVRGLLVTASGGAAPPTALPAWTERLSHLPYAAALAGRWHAAPASQAGDMHAQASRRGLGLFLAAHGAGRAEDRYAALRESYRVLYELCMQSATIPRLSSLARVAWEYGQRAIAVGALGHAVSLIGSGGVIPMDEPFLAAAPRFDRLDPMGRLDDWMFASLLEQLEKLQAYSSYYTGRETLPRLQALQKLGFQSEEMNRRVRLIQARFPA